MGNPVKAVVILLSGFTIFFLVFSYMTGPLTTIWDVAENASPENAPDVKTNLWHTWLLIMMMVIILLGVAFFAHLHGRDEQQTYLR